MADWPTYVYRNWRYCLAITYMYIDSMLPQYWRYHWYSFQRQQKELVTSFICCNLYAIINNIYIYTSADPEGGTGGPDTPWDFSEVGSCVVAWWVGEGVQRLFLPYYYQFFLACFARQYYRNILHVYILQSSMFSMELSTSFSLYISLIQIMNRIQLPIPCFYERAFSDFSCLELHDFTSFKPNNFSGGGPPDPLPDTWIISKLPCHLCICVERGLQLYKKHALPKKKKLICK